jgi:CheY-like chemotaxis protein
LAVAAEIERHPEWGHAAVLILSSAGGPDDPGCCRSLGVQAFLTKPVAQSDLLRAIQDALGKVLVDAKGREVLPPSGPVRCPPSGPPIRRLRVLLAEDNPVNQRLSILLLEKHGHTVTVVSNGKEALAALGIRGQGSGVRGQESAGGAALTPDSCSLTSGFDLVLMDVQMPEINGLDVTKALRRWEQGTGRHLPVIALTAHALKGDRERCLEAGMDGYVTKPIQDRELWRAVRALVSSPATADEEAGVRERSADAPGAGMPSGAPTHPTDSLVFDRATVLARVGGDVAVLKRIVDLFLTECPRTLQAIRAAAAATDAAALADAAHYLKSMVGNMAAADAFAAAKQLEAASRQGDWGRVPEILDVLEPTTEQLRAVLAALGQENLT